MNAPRITNPTNKVNFYFIKTDKGKYWYSYDTCIAFESSDGLIIRENDWSTTTGGHLNYINPNHSIRISGQDFEALLTSV